MFLKKKIVIAGGSGFIGREMAARWSARNEVIVLTRGSTANEDNAYGAAKYKTGQAVQWDAQTPGEWTTVLEGADVLINLTGKSVNCRYTPENKQLILSSRVLATKVLGHAVRQCSRPPLLWINAASATIYRNAQDHPQDEATGEMHNDFSVRVCKAWEAAFNAQKTPHTRKAILRTAIVLGKGGVLVPFKRLARLGLGGHQGNGQQMFSWIHIADLCRIVEWIEEHQEAQGTYNASAPGAVTNHAFMQAIRKALHIPFGLPAPEWMLQIGARLIGTETELLLKSRWVVPARLIHEGFTFQHPAIEKALANLLTNEGIKDSHGRANK